MSYLRPGYWGRKYWTNNYWDIDYWPGFQYGVILPSLEVQRKPLTYKHDCSFEFVFELNSNYSFYSAIIKRKENINLLLIDEDLWIFE